jgi:hypothetical protein
MRLNLHAPAMLAAGSFLAFAGCAGGGPALAPPSGPSQLAHSRAAAAGARTGTLSFADVAASRGIVPIANPARLRLVDPASVKAQIDVSQYGVPSDPGEVNEYAAKNPKNKAPFCQIGPLSGINAIETDASGNLWVPYVTSAGGNQVVEYAPDCGAAGTVLSDPNGQAVDIAFAKNGTIYVSDILGPSSSTTGQISVYPKGDTSPTGELTNANVFYSLGVAVDSKGNVYQSYLGASASDGGVLEFASGKGGGKVLTGIAISEPGTVFVDKKDNIIVPDQGGLALDTYAPPYTKLTSSFALQGLSIQCAVNKAESDVACADRANDTVDVYTYPAGKYEYSFSNGLSSTTSTIGIAQDPRY